MAGSPHTPAENRDACSACGQTGIEWHNGTADPAHCPAAFAEKMRYWREHGTPAVHFQGGKSFFHNTTVAAEVRKATADGNAVPKADKYRWI